MKKIILITFFLIFLLTVQTVTAIEEGTATAIAQAVQELKTVDIYFGFSTSITKDTSVSKILNFTPVDWGNKSWVKVSLIRIVDEQSGSPTIYMWVNGTPCNTPSITATIGRGQYVADFECTNVLNGTGAYNITIRPAAFSLDNVHFRAWVTYVTDTTAQQINVSEMFASAVWKRFYGLGTPPLMSATEYYCENDTLVKNRTVDICEKGKCETVIGVERIKCDWGCSNNECRQPPYLMYGTIFALIIVASIIYILITHKT